MKKQQHTPGPWFITGRMTKYVEARIPGRMIQEVASCGPTAADNGYGDQQMANARLIAAAPDLLEALEEIVSAADGDGWCQLDANLRKARAAIAKATGS